MLLGSFLEEYKNNGLSEGQLADTFYEVFGSDFDGGFGADQTPEGLETVGDLLLIVDSLRERGYAETDVEAIMRQNFIRKLQQTLPDCGNSLYSDHDLQHIDKSVLCLIL